MSLDKAREDLNRLHAITLDLQELDLDDESNLDRLVDLQLEQVELRGALTSWMEQLRQHSDCLNKIQECIQSEQKFQLKLSEKRSYFKSKIDKLQVGAQSRSVYAGNLYQAEGYFVDRKN